MDVYEDRGLFAGGMKDCGLTGDGRKDDWGLSPDRTSLPNDGEVGVKGESIGEAGEDTDIDENDDLGLFFDRIVSPLNAGI